ncbi:hypothetical protein ACWGE0_39950 [Lentzea sp. NPDC054927]
MPGRRRRAAPSTVTTFAEAVTGLALARYGEESGVYLFYCDDEWNVVSDTMHESVGVAIRQAIFEFEGLEFRKLG